jgi:subtilisin family serine protease
MKKTFSLFLFVLGLTLPGMLSAQSSAYPQLFEEGVLHLMVHSGHEKDFPEWEDASQREQVTAPIYEDLFSLAQAYGMYRLEQAFRTRSEALDRTFRLHFTSPNLSQLASELEKLPYVALVERIPTPYPLYLPNDYDSTNQYYLQITQAPRAWDITQGDPDVVIAVVDAAIMTNHIDLAPNMWVNPGEIPGNGVDDDGNGYIDDIHGSDPADNDGDPNPPNPAPAIGSFTHGTQVAGSAAAATDNGLGIAGMAFNCRIMGVKIKSSFNVTNNLLDGAAAFQGVDYAINNGADVINMSFVFGSPNVVWESLVNAGYNQGVVLVGGAGNSGQNEDFFPAAYPNVISVAATNGSDRRSGFSTYHSTVDLVAPGSGIRTTSHSTQLSPRYGNVDGTSFSSPIVAGVAALMVSANRCISPGEVDSILKATAVNIDALNPGFNGLLGAGRVDAAAAVASAVSLVGLPPAATYSQSGLTTCDGTLNFTYLGNGSRACLDSIHWTFNNQTSNAFNPTFQVDSSGTYRVRLWVQNGVGVDSSAQDLTIQVGTTPLVEAGGDANGQLTTCFGQQVQLFGTTSIPLQNASFRWNPGQGLSNPNIRNPILTAVTGQTYSLTVTDPIGCQGTDELKVVLVPGGPQVYAGLDQSILSGDSVQLNASGTGNSLSYRWSPGSSLSDSTIANPIAKPGVTTRYSVEVSDVNNCIATDEVQVNVAGVGIEEELAKGIEILSPAPQPARNLLSFRARFSRPGMLRLTAYDLQGRQISEMFAGKVAAGDFQWQWLRPGRLGAGLYLVKWEFEGMRKLQKVRWQ